MQKEANFTAINIRHAFCYVFGFWMLKIWKTFFNSNSMKENFPDSLKELLIDLGFPSSKSLILQFRALKGKKGFVLA